MKYTEGECLGRSCRFYIGRDSFTCFKLGVLPRCSPSLKEKRIKLDNTAPKLYEALRQAQVYIARSEIRKETLGLTILEEDINEALAKAEGK